MHPFFPPTDEAKYKMKDEEFESKYECSLPKILARPNKEKLFEVNIYFFTSVVVNMPLIT